MNHCSVSTTLGNKQTLPRVHASHLLYSLFLFSCLSYSLDFRMSSSFVSLLFLEGCVCAPLSVKGHSEDNDVRRTFIIDWSHERGEQLVIPRSSHSGFPHLPLLPSLISPLSKTPLHSPSSPLVFPLYPHPSLPFNPYLPLPTNIPSAPLLLLFLTQTPALCKNSYLFRLGKGLAGSRRGGGGINISTSNQEKAFAMWSSDE